MLIGWAHHQCPTKVAETSSLLDPTKAASRCGVLAMGATKAQDVANGSVPCQSRSTISANWRRRRRDRTACRPWIPGWCPGRVRTRCHHHQSCLVCAASRPVPSSLYVCVSLSDPSPPPPYPPPWHLPVSGLVGLQAMATRRGSTSGRRKSTSRFRRTYSPHFTANQHPHPPCRSSLHKWCSRTVLYHHNHTRCTLCTPHTVTHLHQPTLT